MIAWALRLDRRDAAALDAVRLHAGIEVLEVDSAVEAAVGQASRVSSPPPLAASRDHPIHHSPSNPPQSSSIADDDRRDACPTDTSPADQTSNTDTAELWLRGSDPTDLSAPAIRALPALRRYTVLADGQLIAVDHRVPEATLPQGRWLKLRDFLAVTAPRAALPGRLDTRVPLTLIRGGAPAEPNLMLTDAPTFRRFALTASAIRLQPLSFALDADNRVLVRGTPLPPLPGASFHLADRVAVPLGLTFAGGFTRKDVAELLKLDDDEIALFESDGQWSLLLESDFVAAHRASVRAST